MKTENKKQWKRFYLLEFKRKFKFSKSKNKERWIVRVLPDFLVHTKPWPSLVFSLVIHLPKELSKVHVCRVSSCFLSGIFYEEKRERRERDRERRLPSGGWRVTGGGRWCRDWRLREETRAPPGQPQLHPPGGSMWRGKQTSVFITLPGITLKFDSGTASSNSPPENFYHLQHKYFIKHFSCPSLAQSEQVLKPLKYCIPTWCIFIKWSWKSLKVYKVLLLTHLAELQYVFEWRELQRLKCVKFHRIVVLSHVKIEIIIRTLLINTTKF